MLEFDRSQLMRGSLEGCILKIISLRTTYGYEIIELLKESGFRDVSEGTIYPMLIRLEKRVIEADELAARPETKILHHHRSRQMVSRGFRKKLGRGCRCG